MAQSLIESAQQVFAPKAEQGVCAWASEHIKLVDSARSNRFDVDVTPYLRAPLELIVGANDYREVIIQMPTGAGKTTLYDVLIPYFIAHEPGNLLLTMLTAPEALRYCESRLNPILDNCEPIAHLLPKPGIKGKHKRTKKTAYLPHMQYKIGAANPTDAQSISCRWVLGDEAWDYAPGMIDQLRRRTHDRHNAKCVFVGQAGLQGDDFDQAWQQTDKRLYHLRCQGCDELFFPSLDCMRYPDARRDDGTSDYEALRANTTLVCPHCEHNHPDTAATRRAMTLAGGYKVTNTKTALSEKVGFRANAFALSWISWGTLAVEWRTANEEKEKGNLEPLRNFLMKRMAEADRSEEIYSEAITVPSSSYKLGDDCPDEFGDVLLSADKQLDHLVYVIRAFDRNDNSRLLEYGRAVDEVALRELQLERGIKDLRTCIDCGHEMADVFAACARYKWVALRGSDRKEWAHATERKSIQHRAYSRPIKQRIGFGKHAAEKRRQTLGFCFKIEWSNPHWKRALYNRRRLQGQKDSAGNLLVPNWEIPQDAPEKYLKEVNQRPKPPSKPGGKETWTGQGKDHAHDCECQILVMRQMIADGLLK